MYRMNTMNRQTAHIHRYQGDGMYDQAPVHMMLCAPPPPMLDHMIDLWPKSLQGASFTRLHSYLDSCWAEGYDRLVPGGIACVIISDIAKTEGKEGFKIYPNHARVISGMIDQGFTMLPSIVWKKPIHAPNKYLGSGMLPAGSYVTLEHEYILLFRKGPVRGFTDEEKKLRARSAIFWDERNLWFSDIWTTTHQDHRRPLSQLRKYTSIYYPLEIAHRLIMMHTIYEDVVFDPWSITGISGLAALSTCRSSLNHYHDENHLKEALLVPSKRSSKGHLNAYIADRYQRQYNCAFNQDTLLYRYKNRRHQLPVKTRQEIELRLLQIKSIRKTGQEIRAKYTTYQHDQKTPSL